MYFRRIRNCNSFLLEVKRTQTYELKKSKSPKVIKDPVLLTDNHDLKIDMLSSNNTPNFLFKLQHIWELGGPQLFYAGYGDQAFYIQESLILMEDLRI